MPPCKGLTNTAHFSLACCHGHNEPRIDGVRCTLRGPSFLLEEFLTSKRLIVEIVELTRVFRTSNNDLIGTEIISLVNITSQYYLMQFTRGERVIS